MTYSSVCLRVHRCRAALRGSGSAVRRESAVLRAADRGLWVAAFGVEGEDG